ncbi:MAG: hypothetical protein ACLFUS_13485 [Candidatus Sumerlaeia bacterium]
MSMGFLHQKTSRLLLVLLFGLGPCLLAQDDGETPTVESIPDDNDNAPYVEVITPAESTAGLPLPDAQAGPLGLGDSILLLQEAEGFLLNTTGTQTQAVRKNAVKNISAVREYCRQIIPNLQQKTRYQWTRLGRPRVDAKKSDFDDLTPDSNIQNVTAIRFSARFGDVEVEEFHLFDDHDQDTALEVKGMVVRNIPKAETIYLDTPMDVSRATIVARHGGKRKRRIIVEAGVADRFLFERQAAHLCDQSLELLQAGKISESLLSLIRARKTLERFRLEIDPMVP